MTPSSAARRELAAHGAALERRAFLRMAGVLAASGFLPSGCGGVPERLAPDPAVGLAVLSPRAYATFTAAAMRLVGPTGAGLIATRAVDVGRIADGLLARTAALAGPLGQALAVLEFGVWPLVAKVRPFTALDGPAQDAVLADLIDSRLDLKRQLAGGVRSLALLAFYGSAASRVVSGYPGPFGTADVPIGAAMIGAADVW